MANTFADMAPAMSELRQGLTGIAGLQMQQQRLSEESAHRRETERVAGEQLTIAKDVADREKIKFNYQEEELKKKKAWGKQLSPVSGIAPFIDQNPKTKEFLINAVKGAGFEYQEENGVALVQNDALPFIQNQFKTNLEFNKNAVEASKVDSAARFQKVYKQINELRANEKEVKPEMMQQLKALGEEYAGLENAKKEVDKGINRQTLTEQKQALVESGDWANFPLSARIAFEMGIKTGDLSEPNKILTEITKSEVKGPSQVPHTIVKTSEDGKTEQIFQYNPRSKAEDKYDIPIGTPRPAKSQVINITTAGKEAEGFKSWTPEAKQQAFMYNVLTKEPPVSARGFAANDRQIYAKEYAQWQVGRGFKAQDIALMQADYRAGDVSLKNMSRQEGPMNAFVGNINKQIAKVQELYDNNDRIGIRLFDLPVREIKMRAKGSGDEAVKASYLLEISNEIGKLSSGASASVQQLSDSAKEDWKKVHDPNLSFKEIMKVVNATRDQANMRMASWREAKQEVRQSLGQIGVIGQSGGGEIAGTEFKVGDLYQGKKIKGINRETKQLNVEGLGVISY